MSAFWTFDRIADALAKEAVGKLPRGSQQSTGITTDTRKIAKGNVFVALRGERFDGHDYLTQAVRDGAAAEVVSRVPKWNARQAPVFEGRDRLVTHGALPRDWARAWGKPTTAGQGPHRN